MGDCQEPTGTLAFSTSSLLSSTVEIISQTRLQEGFQPQSLSYISPFLALTLLLLTFVFTLTAGSREQSIQCQKGAQVLSRPLLITTMFVSTGGRRDLDQEAAPSNEGQHC